MIIIAFLLSLVGLLFVSFRGAFVVFIFYFFFGFVFQRFGDKIDELT